MLGTWTTCAEWRGGGVGTTVAVEEVGGQGLGVGATGSWSSREVEGDTDGGGHSPVFYRYYTVILFSQPDDLFVLALLSPFWDFKNNSILIRTRNPVLYLRCNFWLCYFFRPSCLHFTLYLIHHILDSRLNPSIPLSSWRILFFSPCIQDPLSHFIFIPFWDKPLSDIYCTTFLSISICIHAINDLHLLLHFISIPFLGWDSSITSFTIGLCPIGSCILKTLIVPIKSNPVPHKDLRTLNIQCCYQGVLPPLTSYCIHTGVLPRSRS